MSVRDHGIEALRKSAVAIDADTYQLRTVISSSLVGVYYDSFAVTYPTATQEVYTFKTGGLAGTTVKTVTINYTDSTKAFILNAAGV